MAIDATPLTVATGGIPRYTAELTGALAAAFPDDTYFLISDQRPPSESIDRLVHSHANVRARLGASSFLEKRWWLIGLPKALARVRADVFHGTDFSVPYVAAAPSVMTLHDLSPWLDTGWHHNADRVRARTPYLVRLGLATRIITHSEAVRRQAINWFGISPARVVAVPLAASSHFRPQPSREAGEAYFLYAGTLEPRKNLGMLVDAWKAVREKQPVRLVLAGRRRADFVQPGEWPGLELRGEVPDADLPGLYSGAVAVLYPSLYEGFGLPVLEAMSCGAAVIASRDAAISEVAGGAAIQLDARDTRAWAQAMLAAVENPPALATWRERAVERSRQFSWPRTAAGTRKVYEEAINHFA